MSLETPIPRDTRERNITLTDGQTVLGPFDFPIWDVQDVALYLQEPTWTRFQKMEASDFTVAPVDVLPGFFTVTLPAARPDGTKASVRGLRVPQRLTDVTRDGIIRSVPLEGELDRSAAVQQEIRRDMDRALEANDALDDAVTAAEQARDDAFAYRNQADSFAQVASEKADETLAFRNQASGFAQTASDKADEAAASAQLLATQILPDATDFDTIVTRGTFVVKSDVHAPVPGAANVWVVDPVPNPADADNVVQRAILLSGGSSIFRAFRRRIAGVWQAWVIGGFDAKDIGWTNGIWFPEANTVEEVLVNFGNWLWSVENDPWGRVPPGSPVFLWDHIPGVSLPPTGNSYRFVELTAGLTGPGGYNQGCLSSESVSGSAPLINATAVVSLAGSPMQGQTIRLINTERRFMRASATAGELQDDALQDHSHSQTRDNVYGGGSAGVTSFFWSSAAGSTGAVNSGRVSTETRPRNISGKVFLRIK